MQLRVGARLYDSSNYQKEFDMSEYVFGGAGDIDRAIALLVSLDNTQRNALAVLQIDEAIEELQVEYVKSSADASYSPDKDVLARLSGYLAMAEDRENPELK